MLNNIINVISSLLGVSSSGFLKYFKNTLWLFIERFLTMFIGLIVGIAVARCLGPADYGVIIYGLTIYAIVLSIGTLGFDDLIIRESLNNPTKINSIYGTIFICRLLTTILLYFFIFIFIYYTTDSKSFLPVLIIVSAILYTPLGIISVFFQMYVVSRMAVIANIVGYTFAAIVKVLLIIIEAPLIYFAIAMLLDTLIRITILVFFYLKNYGSFNKWKFDKYIMLKFFKVGWPLTIMAVVIPMYYKFDIIMVESILGSDALGKYSVAVRLTDIWYHIPYAISASLFPAIINSKSDYYEYSSRVKKILYVTVWGMLVMAIFITIFSQFIINILYGPAYADSGITLSIYIWCLIFVSLNVITIKWLISENYIILGLYRISIGVIVNIALNYFMIKSYGMNGAAFATLISYFISSYIIDLFFKKTRELFIVKTQCFLLPFIYFYNFLNKFKRVP